MTSSSFTFQTQPITIGASKGLQYLNLKRPHTRAAANLSFAYYKEAITAETYVILIDPGIAQTLHRLWQTSLDCITQGTQ